MIRGNPGALGTEQLMITAEKKSANRAGAIPMQFDN